MKFKFNKSKAIKYINASVDKESDRALYLRLEVMQLAALKA